MAHLSLGKKATALFPHVRDTDGGDADLIQAAFDARAINLGDVIQTAGYHQGSDLGGCTYRVVASGTGTEDGGSFINFTGFQLAAVFDGSLDVDQFGAAGDGSTDDTDEFQAAAAAAIALGASITSRAGRSHRISGTVDLRTVRFVDLRSTITVYQTDEPGIIIGGAATNRLPITAYLHRVVHDGSARLSSRDNPTIRVVGVKNADISVGWTTYFQVYADAADSAIASSAYSNFLIGYTNFCELYGEAGVSWITENTFEFGDCRRLDIIGVGYGHNHNEFRRPCMEGGVINMEKASGNRVSGVRHESGIEVNFADDCWGNEVELTYRSNDTISSVSTDVVVSDPSGANAVYHARRNRERPVTLARISASTPLTNAASGIAGMTAGAVTPGITHPRVATGSAQILDTGIFRIQSMLSTFDRAARIRRILVQSDTALWRPRVYVYDEDGVLLDGSATDYIASTGGWAWQAGGYYGFTSDQQNVRIAFDSLEVHYARIVVFSGATGKFEFFDLTAWTEEPWRPSLAVDAALDPAPLRQTSSPTMSLLPLWTQVRLASSTVECSFRLATATSASASSSATSITVADGTGITVADLIAVHLSDSTTHFTTVSSVSGTTIGLTAGLAASALSGAAVVVSRFTGV